MSSKSISARYGHIKRGLSKGEPLKGKALKLALEILGGYNDNSELSIFMKGIKEKIKSGETLSNYEFHFFVEVVLLYLKLSYNGGEANE